MLNQVLLLAAHDVDRGLQIVKFSGLGLDPTDLNGQNLQRLHLIRKPYSIASIILLLFFLFPHAGLAFVEYAAGRCLSEAAGRCLSEGEKPT